MFGLFECILVKKFLYKFVVVWCRAYGSRKTHHEEREVQNIAEEPLNADMAQKLEMKMILFEPDYLNCSYQQNVRIKTTITSIKSY